MRANVEFGQMGKKSKDETVVEERYKECEVRITEKG